MTGHGVELSNKMIFKYNYKTKLLWMSVCLPLIIAGCAKKNITPQTNTTLAKSPKIGVLLPISGRYKSVGSKMLMGAKMAIAQYPNINLIIRDTKGRPDEALQQFKQLKKEKVSIILGPLLAPCARIISRQKNSNIPVITYASPGKISAPGCYNLGQNIKAQVDKLFDFIFRQSKYNFTPSESFLLESMGERDDQSLSSTAIAKFQYSPKVLAILPNNGYGMEIAQYLGQIQKSMGFTLMPPILFDKDQQKFAEQTKDYQYPDLDPKNLIGIKQDGQDQSDDRDTYYTLDDEESGKDQQLLPDTIIDVIFIPVGGQKLKIILNSLVFHNVITRDMVNKNQLSRRNYRNAYPRPILLAGTNHWHDKNNLGNSFITGAIFAGTNDNSKKIKQLFTSYFATDMDYLTGMCFDSIAIANAYIRSSKPITDITFHTMQGPLNFDADGTTKKMLNIYKITTHKFSEIASTKRH